MPTPLELRPAKTARRRAWKHAKVRVNRDTARRVLAATEREFLGRHFMPVAVTVDGQIILGEPIEGTSARPAAERAAQTLLTEHLGATGLVAQRGDTELILYRLGAERPTLRAYQGAV